MKLGNFVGRKNPYVVDGDRIAAPFEKALNYRGISPLCRVVNRKRTAVAARVDARTRTQQRIHNFIVAIERRFVD